MPPMTGRVIAGRYLLEQPIGRGAMGMVWRAHDQLLDREVAVKEVVLSASIGADERKNAYQRTLREARTAARLSHRGVVTVYDVAEEDGRPWIVMELVPSRSLDQVLLAEGPMKPLRAGRVGQQLLAALAAAHGAGVLHRDVKPSNVLIAVDRSGGGWDERAVLTDFGIAQFEGDPRLTQTGMVMGSPGFTAPERIRGGDATPASDLWSLGATIYAAVEGRGPYEQRGGAITTMSAIINEDAPVAPHAERLGPLIAALLRREPSARPSAAVAARMFAEVLPALSDGPAHPATLRSSYVPAPAAPVASAAAPPAAAPPAAAPPAAAPPAAAPPAAAPPVAVAVPEAAEASVESAMEAAEPPSGAAVHADDAALLDAESAGALVGVGAVAGAAGAAGAAAVAGELTDDEAPAGGGAAEVPPEDSPEASSASSDQGLAADLDGPPASPGATAVAGPGLTELSVPAAAQAPKIAPPPKAKPTFTASKRTEQAGPSFSPSSPSSPSRPTPPAPSQPPQPAQSFSSSRSAWRADPPTVPEPAYEATQYGGSNAQYASYQGPNAQYGGPSQSRPDLARQYAPGTAGRAQGGGTGRRGRTIALIIAALVVAAAIGGGAAYLLHHHSGSGPGTASTTGDVSLANQPGSIQALDTPSTIVPAGWATENVQPSGAAAGFSIAVPPGWTETRSGLVTEFTSPDGARLLDIDLTPHTYTNMVTEAKAVESNDLLAGRFADYHRAALKAAPVRGTTGAFWQFTFIRGDVKTRADDILFIMPTSAGSQSYAIYFRAPDSGWNGTNLPLFEKMLHTFQTVPA